MTPPASPAALIAVPAAAMHRAPSRRSEQVSQVLLGDPVAVLASRGGWRLVRAWDDYQGWVGGRCLVAAGVEGAGPAFEVLPLWANLRHAPDYRVAAATIAFAGSRLPLVEERDRWIALQLPTGATGWTERHRVRCWPGRTAAPPPVAGVVETAHLFLGVPYLWGGCTPLGLDCSGFVQLVWRLHGAHLPRDAHQQAGCGEPVGLADAVAGDLLFFGPEEGGRDRVTHVAICLGEQMIHAAGSDRVRIDRRAEFTPRALFARRLAGAGSVKRET